MRDVRRQVDGLHKKTKPAFNHEAIGLGEAGLYCSKYAKLQIASVIDQRDRAA